MVLILHINLLNKHRLNEMTEEDKDKLQTRIVDCGCE